MTTEQAKTELNIGRIIDAHRDLVFRAWTEPELLAQWWGPMDFTNPVCEVDLRPGGIIEIDMCGPDGTIYPMTGVFKEVSAPAKLVFTTAALDEHANPVLENLNTITFAEQGNKTILTLDVLVTSMTGKGATYLAGMDEGWNQSLDRLDAITQNNE